MDLFKKSWGFFSFFFLFFLNHCLFLALLPAFMWCCFNSSVDASLCCLVNLHSGCACCTVLQDSRELWLFDAMLVNQSSGTWNNMKICFWLFWHFAIFWKQLHESLSVCAATPTTIILRGKTVKLYLSSRTFVWGQDRNAAPVNLLGSVQT